jgi:protein TonB
VPLTLTQEEPQPEKKPEPKPEPKPQPEKMVSKVAPPKTPTPPQQPVVTEPTPPLAAVESDVQTAFSQPAPVKAAPPVQPPTSGKTDPNAEYAGKVHEAVQAAYFYPAAAAAMHFSGRVRVEFQLKDGRVTESHVLQSCGIGLFDKAALQAVQSAQYPQPPEHLRGQELHYQIWVELATH